MAAEIKRLGQMERSKVDERGQYRDVVEVSFMVGSDGPFVVDVPKESYEVETVRAMVQEYADRVTGVRTHFEPE